MGASSEVRTLPGHALRQAVPTRHTHNVGAPFPSIYIATSAAKIFQVCCLHFHRPLKFSFLIAAQNPGSMADGDGLAVDL